MQASKRASRSVRTHVYACMWTQCVALSCLYRETQVSGTNAAIVFPAIAMGFSTSLPDSDLLYSFGYYSERALSTKCTVGDMARVVLSTDMSMMRAAIPSLHVHGPHGLHGAVYWVAT